MRLSLNYDAKYFQIQYTAFLKWEIKFLKKLVGLSHVKGVKWTQCAL